MAVLRSRGEPGKASPTRGGGRTAKRIRRRGDRSAIVEADETMVGGKAKNRAYKPEPKKSTVMVLVERDGRARSFHVANVQASTLKPIIAKMTSKTSHLMTDELATYGVIGAEFAGHSTVNHSADEYVSEAHLHRYLAEFDFRYSNRVKLGIDDVQRTERALRGMVGKRLYYRKPTA